MYGFSGPRSARLDTFTTIFAGTISGKSAGGIGECSKSWLLSAVEAQDNELLTWIFNNKGEEVRDNIITRGVNEYDKISKGLIPLLLEKTNDYQIVRNQFFEIVTTHFSNSKDAINYIKK